MKTEPGTDRITARQLHAAANRALDAMRAHKKQCRQCSLHARNPFAYCDTGWELAKAKSRTEYELTRYKEGYDNGQHELF